MKEDYYIDTPWPTEGPAILDVHQKAYVQGSINNKEPEMGASQDNLQHFVEGEFAPRLGKYWDNACRQNTGIFVARLCLVDTLVGVGKAKPSDDPEEPGVLNIDSLYISPEHHRQRIGTAVLDKIHAAYNPYTYPITRLTVTRWSPAKDFYTWYGFSPTGRPVPPPEPPLAYGIILEQVEMEMHRQA